MKLLRQALHLARAGRPAALATVTRVAGSTPRHPGARMLIEGDGSTFGSIGGGRVEQEVTRVGVEVAAGQAPAQRVTHHLVRDLAMCCGGTMDLWIEQVEPSVEALERAVAAHADRRHVVLMTPLDGSPKRVWEAPSSSRLAGIEDGVFVEPIWPADRLVLFGCGHVARALGPVARDVGFETVVCDDNETGQLDGELAWADRVITSFDLSTVEGRLGGLGASDYLLILTRDHAVDQRILEQSLPRSAELAYLGLIGSPGKIGRFRRRLQAKQVGSPACWERLHAPIGLDIGAETPAEIAVSVVAELIRVRVDARAGRG